MIRFVALTALCAAAVVPAKAQTNLYGVASFSSFGSQSLYAIDASTGAATLIGNTGLRQITGLDWDSASNRLVALTASGDQFSVNTATGMSTLIVDGAFGTPEGSVAMVAGTAYTTIFDNLHSWNGAAWQQVGPSLLPAGADVSGLDVSPALVLGLATNGSAADQLVSFNLGTGAATIIGATGTNASSVAGLAYNFLGDTWYMTDGSSLFSLDTTTGAASLLGAHGVTGFSGIAFVPAPGSAALLGMSALLLTRRRR